MNCHHLSIEERSCIRKYYVDGLSCREIARLIGRNAGTAPREIRRIVPACTAPRLATRTQRTRSTCRAAPAVTGEYSIRRK